MIEQLPGQESLATKYEMNEKKIKQKAEQTFSEFEKKDHGYDPETSKIPGI
jgi:hypothetical protein